MAIRTIDPRSTLETVLAENITTLASLEADPLAASLAPGFQAFHDNDWTKTRDHEVALVIAELKAQALVYVRDADLDDFVDRLDKALLVIVKNQRSDALYAFYFGAKRPAQLRRPTLGKQLDTMATWVQSLTSSPHPALAALGAELEPKIALAYRASKELTATSDKLREFRTIGERRALIDKLNALRKSTHGKLAEIAHTNAAARLPAGYADTFFLHESRPAETSPTKEDVLAKIAAMEAELASLRAELAAFEQAEASESQAAAQREADLAALAEAKKAAAAAAATVAAFEAKLEKK